MGQRLSFNRKGLRLAEARHDGSSRLHLILDSVQMCCLVKIAHYATEPRQESVARQVPLWELEVRWHLRPICSTEQAWVGSKSRIDFQTLIGFVQRLCGSRPS